MTRVNKAEGLSSSEDVTEAIANAGGDTSNENSTVEGKEVTVKSTKVDHTEAVKGQSGSEGPTIGQVLMILANGIALQPDERAVVTEFATNN